MDNESNLICTPLLSSKGTYNIYYISACGLFYDSGVKISFIPPIQIKVTSINSFCSAEPFTEFSFNLNLIPTGRISKSTLKNKNGLIVDFLNCLIEEKKVTCREPNKTIESGEYSLIEVTGVDEFIITITNKLKYEEDSLDFQSQLYQTVNFFNNTFTINVKENAEIPKIISRKPIK